MRTLVTLTLITLLGFSQAQASVMERSPAAVKAQPKKALTPEQRTHMRLRVMTVAPHPSKLAQRANSMTHLSLFAKTSATPRGTESLRARR